jgi:hypothetical protein
VDESYYAAVYAEGETKEWCMTEDEDGYVNSVTVGGFDAWYMLGHTFWSEEFSRKFVSVLEKIYDLPETVNLLWESIYMDNLDILKMKMRRYNDDVIFEFDTLDELRLFDESYVSNTRSTIIKSLAERLNCRESDIVSVTAFKTANNAAAGMRFCVGDKKYEYDYETATLKEYR